MNKVVVVCDSTIDLGLENYQKFDIKIIPLIVREGDEVFHDGIDITREQLYAMVKKTGRLPQTATEGPGVIAEYFEKYINEGFDIVYVGIGSGLSSCFNAARLAASNFDEGRVYLIDSENLSSASGLLAMECCKLRDEGKSAKEIYETVQPLSKLTIGQFGVETLDYLYKGGRCSGIAKVMGNLFHIHPLLRVVDNKLIVYKKIRGKTQAVLDEQIKSLKADYPNIKLPVVITHAGADKDVIDYAFNEVSKIVGKENTMVTPAGCIISSHCGYGTIGILYIKNN